MDARVTAFVGPIVDCIPVDDSDGVIGVGASGEPPRRTLAFRVGLDQGSQQILDRHLALGPVGLPERSDGAIVSPSGNNSIDVASWADNGAITPFWQAYRAEGKV